MVGGGVVDPAAVGLDLERGSRGREDVEDFPRVGYAERLAAAEGDVGNALGGDVAREAQRLVTRQLVAPCLVGTGFLAAGDAAGAATVGQLPGDEEGRTVIGDRAPVKDLRVYLR